MGLFSKLFGTHTDPAPAWRAEAAARRTRGEPALADLYDRLADAPEDVRAAFDLGTALVSSGEADRAVPVLTHALALLPFDAILRSELALAEAHAGRPRDALATLALHPCLADDPGALYWLGWCALATGDLELAHRAAEDLAPHRAAARVRELLVGAIARAEGAAFDPDDTRDRYFVETGGVLIGSEHVGDAALAMMELGWPLDVVAADDAAREVAKHLAESSAGDVLPLPPQGRLPRAVVVASDAAALTALGDRLGSGGEVLTYVATLDVARPTPLAPDLVGILRGARPPRGTLGAFAASHRALLPREHVAPYVPDLPREEPDR